MVDVGGKPVTRRSAEAEARVHFPPEVFARVLSGDLPKGGVIEPARLAGVQGAKRTADWIPLCHPLPLDCVELEIQPGSSDDACLRIRCRAQATSRTGVEMEALVGVCAAALTLYDMTKALSKAIRIEGIRLLSKSGGRSGNWKAS